MALSSHCPNSKAPSRPLRTVIPSSIAAPAETTIPVAPWLHPLNVDVPGGKPSSPSPRRRSSRRLRLATRFSSRPPSPSLSLLLLDEELLPLSLLLLEEEEEEEVMGSGTKAAVASPLRPAASTASAMAARSGRCCRSTESSLVDILGRPFRACLHT